MPCQPRFSSPEMQGLHYCRESNPHLRSFDAAGLLSGRIASTHDMSYFSVAYTTHVCHIVVTKEHLADPALMVYN
jgi:hypothetical protein